MLSKSRGEILSGMEKIRAEITQIFADADHWNRMNPEEEPLDPDPTGELQKLASRIDGILAKQ